MAEVEREEATTYLFSAVKDYLKKRIHVSFEEIECGFLSGKILDALEEDEGYGLDRIM